MLISRDWTTIFQAFTTPLLRKSYTTQHRTTWSFSETAACKDATPSVARERHPGSLRGTHHCGHAVVKDSRHAEMGQIEAFLHPKVTQKRFLSIGQHQCSCFAEKSIHNCNQQCWNHRQFLIKIDGPTRMRIAWLSRPPTRTVIIWSCPVTGVVFRSGDIGCWIIGELCVERGEPPLTTTTIIHQ